MYAPGYGEVMAVQGWRHAVALCFWNDPPAGFPVFVFSVRRQEGRPDFSDTDLDALETIHSVMEPAVLRFHERADAHSVYEALAEPVRQAGRAVVVVNSRMQVVRANQSALALFRRDTRMLPALLDSCRAMSQDRLELLRADPVSGARRRRCVRTHNESTRSARITMFCRDPDGLAESSFVIEIDDHRGSGDDLARMVRLPPGMTPGERDVSIALAEGLSNQEIADRLGKSLAAVKFLLHRAYAKAGTSNRAALVALLRSGLPDKAFRRGKRQPDSTG